MQPRTRALVAAGVLAATGLALGILSSLAVAIPLIAGAAGIAALVIEEDVDPQRPGQATEGNLHAVAGLAQELELTGRGIHVPPGPTLEATRLFVPARDAEAAEIPALQADTVIHRGPPGVLGLSLPPPGRGLEQAWADEHGLPQGGGREAAALHLRQSLPQLGLGAEVRVSTNEDRVRVAYEHTLLGDACADTRLDLAPWDVQGGCPVCSLVASLVARAHEAPVRLVACQALDEDRVELELEVMRA